MKLSRLCDQLQHIAPLALAEDWDNVGLLAGDPEQNIKQVLFTIDLTSAVLAEAKQKKVNLIVAYHPPLFEPMKKVLPGRGPSPHLYEVIRNRMAIYSLHTALDAVAGGINDVLAEIVGIADGQPLEATPTTTSHYKLIVFIPTADVERVSAAIFAAGAGVIGADARYTKCSFRTEGTGTFQCGADSNPTIGRPGSYEQVQECRFETVVPAGMLGQAIPAMIQAHPYEEVAYDLVPLAPPPATTGLGRWGDLEKPVNSKTLIENIKTALKVPVAGLIGPAKRQVRRAAVGAGSCGSIYQKVIQNGCDFYLTGELKHHHALALQEAGVTTLCVSHSNSERIILPQLARRLRKMCPGVTTMVSSKDRDPFTWQ